MLYPIDFCGDKIYLKVGLKINCYQIHVLNTSLVSLYSFDSSHTMPLWNILVKKDVIIYYWKNKNFFDFDVKSITNNRSLQKFSLKFESDIRCALGPHSNIFIFDPVAI